MTLQEKSVLLSRRYMLKTEEAEELVKTVLDTYDENGCDVCGEMYYITGGDCGCTEVEINLYLDNLEHEDMVIDWKDE